MKTKKFIIFTNTNAFEFSQEVTEKEFKRILGRLAKQFDESYSNGQFAWEMGASKIESDTETATTTVKAYTFNDGPATVTLQEIRCKPGYQFIKKKV